MLSEQKSTTYVHINTILYLSIQSRYTAAVSNAHDLKGICLQANDDPLVLAKN